MAYGQIDPARLEGDALTRWYLRSPADIEQERQAGTAQRYADFFGGDSALSQAPDQAGQDAGVAAGTVSRPMLVTAVPNPRQPPASTSQTDIVPTTAVADRATGDSPSNVRLAAIGGLCLGCHGTGISPRPPVFSKPPWATPWRPPPSPAPKRPARPHPPQCAMQNMRDSRICSREPNLPWQAVCLESASEREAHCIASDGEINWPPLETHDRR